MTWLELWFLLIVHAMLAILWFSRSMIIISFNQGAKLFCEWFGIHQPIVVGMTKHNPPLLLWFCLLWILSLLYSGNAYPGPVIQHIWNQNKIKLSPTNFSLCNLCTVGKLTKSLSTLAFPQASHPLDLIHSEILGPISPSTLPGYQYVLYLIDEFTLYNTLYLLQDQSGDLVKFKKMQVSYGKTARPADRKTQDQLWWWV